MTRLPCAAARAIVAQRGAIVLGLSPDIYDRFVSSRQYCMYDERTEQAFAPARDYPQCPVGFRCRERENNRSFDD